MKILNISTSIFGGAGRAAFRLHEALLASGVSSFFLCMDRFTDRNIFSKNVSTLYREPTLFDRLKNKIPGNKLLQKRNEELLLREEFLGLMPRLNCEIATLPFSGYDLLQHPSVRSCDVIILHWVADMLDYKSFFKGIDKPVIWTLHDQNPFQGIFHYNNDEKRNASVSELFDRKIYDWKKEAIESSGSRLHIIAPSKWLAGEAAKSAAFGNLPITVIPYSLDLNVFSMAEKRKTREALSIPNDKVVLLFVAESVANFRKGFDLMLTALQSVSPDEVVLVALGNNVPDTGSKVKVIKAGIVSDNTELAKYYVAADAFVLPSREDNLPNVMLESFACGTPVIGFPIGGVGEHVTNFETGMLAADVSGEALADALRMFIHEKQKFNPQFIRHYAETNFNPELQALRYAAIFKGIV